MADKEYIEREALEDFLRKEFSNLGGLINYIRMYVPTADVVEVRHGEWIEKGRYFPYCSECGTWTDWSNGTAEFNYCPHCGAKMDGKGEGE